MKLIIAGGRNYHLNAADFGRLDSIAGVTEVVLGGATGVDTSGKVWAIEHDLPFRIFRPDWDTHGKAAGPIRNREMAEYADAVALFPGGRGTESMFEEAIRARLKIFDWRSREKSEAP